ncbi:MAG: hypothetical protein KJ593_05455 [Candidatus Omnitrophica bacterium]|nr:hypothetical protein [Candidatus Omnitrophota bacterium]
MIFKWESEKMRLLRFMKISPKKKLEWLRQMNEFFAKYSSRLSKSTRQHLRESR